MKKKLDFNTVFNAFILVGMTVAIVLATAIRLGRGDESPVLLIVAAFGSLTGILGTVCSANGIIWNFLFGAVNVAIYSAMCFVGAKYGNALLHLLYFLPMQFIGFAQWRRRGTSGKEGLKARRLSLKGRVIAGSAFVLGSAALFLLLRISGAGSTPLADAVSVVCNIIGQLLLSTAYMEQWFFWIGVNVASILMWSLTLAASPGDSYALIYIIKYSFYLVNSLNGLRIWIERSRRVPEKAVPGQGLEM